MAKRKRLTPANPIYLEPEDSPAAAGLGPVGRSAPPIADVAREAAASAALEELSQTVAQAREEGRMIISLPLAQIQTDYLVRDRVAVDEDEMSALMSSIRARGQQAPVEVTELGEGRYGLISGWRRCLALSRLAEETGEDQFRSVLALLRRPADSSDAYQAMVEENELRVGLSYYERARIVAKAVEQGVFPSQQMALRGLFANASRAKRSKIGSFTTIVAALDDVLRFPHAIAERQGLAMAQLLSRTPEAEQTLKQALTKANSSDADEEHGALTKAVAVLEKRLNGSSEPKKAPPKTHRAEIAPGISFKTHSDGRVTLGGAGLTETLRDELIAWLRAHAGKAEG